MFHIEQRPAEAAKPTIGSAVPHVGIAVGPTQLIWITPKNVFLEEVLEEGRRYAITGFEYKIASERLTLQGEAFQAIYTRQPKDRPVFHTFMVKP